jgi:YfiH family protein
MSAPAGWLTHPLLSARGAAHGFGTRACRPSEALWRPKQVHGARVAVVRRTDVSLPPRPDADAVVSERPGLPVGIVTADCLPILVAAASGTVAAVHAGWRGLAAGVIGAALEALAELGSDPRLATAVIGPHVCSACYEVDAPVVDALTPRFAPLLAGALRETRAGHWQLGLSRLAEIELARAGLAPERVATLPGTCTACDAERFASHRRDGPGAGRLVHWITACDALVS